MSSQDHDQPPKQPPDQPDASASVLASASAGIPLEHWDVAIIGGGPAGQQAALNASKAGCSVILIEQQAALGGSCVQYGTIPSKTLRETAWSVASTRQRIFELFPLAVPKNVEIDILMRRKNSVIDSNERSISEMLRKAGVFCKHGRAHFIDAHTLHILDVHRQKYKITANTIIVATGSRPRTPNDIPVDHEHILDSDSILSMVYLPKSLIVLGAGVIACEYASIFLSLGVDVTIIDRAPIPLTFLDQQMSRIFVETFTRLGGRFLGGQPTPLVGFNGLDAVEVTLADGKLLRAEKVLCTLGRVANVESLQLSKAGIESNGRGLIDVNGFCQTKVPHIYAVGDVIGPPSLASASMQQGRLAVQHALGLPVQPYASMIPSGIYTIPELSSVGLSEEQAKAQNIDYVVGIANFTDVARGQIANMSDGLLKIIADADAGKILGVHIIGESACDLVHIGQMAMVGKLTVHDIVDITFNFPTMAETYKVAALDAVEQIEEKHRQQTQNAAQNNDGKPRPVLLPPLRQAS